MVNFIKTGSLALSLNQTPVVIKRDFFTQGSVWGEKITSSGTLSLINGVIQPIDPTDSRVAAGFMRAGDYDGFFHVTDNVLASGVTTTGSFYQDTLIQYPSGGDWFEVIAGHTELMGNASIFTYTQLRRVVE